MNKQLKNRALPTTMGSALLYLLSITRFDNLLEKLSLSENN